MYKLTETLEVGLVGRITTRALIGLKELGLYDLSIDNETILKTVLEIFIDKERLDKLIKIMFNDVKEYDFEEVNVSEVFVGYQDFLSKLVGKTIS